MQPPNSALGASPCGVRDERVHQRVHELHIDASLVGQGAFERVAYRNSQRNDHLDDPLRSPCPTGLGGICLLAGARPAFPQSVRDGERKTPQPTQRSRTVT